VFDSLRKSMTEYQNLVDTLKKAWKCFVKHQVGVSDTDELVWRPDFPVRSKFHISLISFSQTSRQYYITDCSYTCIYSV